MPFDVLRWVVQYLHVFSGVLWIGGGFYTLLVQLPAVLAAPAPSRGPVLAEVGPRQIRYLLRVAEVTIATGILNAILTGRLAHLSETPLWSWVIGLGFVLAVGLYVFLQTAVKPLLFRMLALGRATAGGDSGAAAQMPALVDRFRRLGYAQIGIGALIVLLMVTARFS